jgi:hypothetical protein
MTRETQAITSDQTATADIVLPEQYFTARSALAEPERRLRLAILEDALRYYQQNAGAVGRRGRALYEDAADWFASPDRSEPFAFENVCDALGLDAHYIRRCLRQWHEAKMLKATGAPLELVRQLVDRRRAA